MIYLLCGHLIPRFLFCFVFPPIRTTPSQCISSRAGGISVWPTVSWNSTWLWTTALQTSCGSLTPTSLTIRSPSSTAWRWRTEWSGSTLMVPSCTGWGTNLCFSYVHVSVQYMSYLFDGALHFGAEQQKEKNSNVEEHPVRDSKRMHIFGCIILAPPCLLFCVRAGRFPEKKCSML